MTSAPDALAREVAEAVSMARGHFRYESGHHGDLWLELDALLLDARRLRRWAVALAARVRGWQPQVVCGPLAGGAFLAQLIAAELAAGFVFAERLESGARYRIAPPLRPALAGKRVLFVDDAVNAASALRATLADAATCGATPVGFAALLTLGDAAARLAQESNVPLVTLALLARAMWPPEDCPPCRAGTPLVDRVAAS